MRRFVWSACALLVVADAVRAQPNPPRATIVRDLRIDAAAEDFSYVGGLHVGPSGQMAIRFPQDAQVRLYDSTGKLIARAGRRGSGPGEFETPGSIMWLGDTLAVHEALRKRITYFAPNGTLLRAPLVPAAVNADPFSASTADTSYVFFSPTALHTDGSMVGIAYLRLRARGNAGSMDRAIVRWTPAQGPRFVAPLPDHLDPRWQITISGLSNPVPFAFQPQTVTARDGSRFAHLTSLATSARGGEFTVQLIGANGDPQFTRTFAYRSEPILRRAIDSAITAMFPRAGATEGPPGVSARFQAIARERIPPAYAGVTGIRLGRDNTIWVDLAPTTAERVTLVLNSLGDAVATVAVPLNVRIREASATRIWATELDADGLASVVRYRVSGISCGAVPC